jgi:hypothetical protein
MHRVLFVLLSLMFLLTLDTWAQKRSVPEGWHGVKACEFSFIVPNDVVQRKVQPIDSCVAEFVGKNIAVTIDYGMYSGPSKQSEDDKDYKTSPISVNGKVGELATYYNDWKNPETKSIDKIWYADVNLITPRRFFVFIKTTFALSFSVSRYESADPETVKTIYQSLKYLGR